MQDEREFPLTEPESVDRLRFQMERYVFGRSISGYEADNHGMSLQLSDGSVIRFEVREQEGKPGVDVILYVPVEAHPEATEVVQ